MAIKAAMAATMPAMGPTAARLSAALTPEISVFRALTVSMTLSTMAIAGPMATTSPVMVRIVCWTFGSKLWNHCDRLVMAVVTAVIAGASIIGVAVGFGSQKLVQDFITGIFLLMENTMQVGDSVTVAGVSGTVENLSVRTMRLRASDGSLHIIPFSSVTTVNNASRGLGNAAVRVSVSYDTDISQAISELKAIGAALRNDPAFSQRILADMEVWGVDAVDGSMVTLAGQMRCVDKGRWGVQREINRRVLKRFRELGITIADPRERPLMLPSEGISLSSGDA